MFIGALLVCANLSDVASCDVKLNMRNLYDTKQECVTEMRGAAQYAAEFMMLVAKPYCFPINSKPTT